MYVERRGRIEPTDVAFASEAELMHAIERILAPLGRRVDEASPLCDARLPDGSRVNVVVPPLSLSGPLLTIRRFRRQGFSLRELVANGTMPAAAAELLAVAVTARASVLVSGGTGSGKTTTLNALSGAIPAGERIVTIEDAAELSLRQEHVLRLEARPPNLEGRGEVTIRQLVRNALRMRPDRIVVGEVRGAEALDLLQALNTGHDGSLSTVHANSPEDALRRIETLALMADVGLPHAAVREQVASAVDLVVHQERRRDGVARGDLRGRGGAGRGRRGHARAARCAAAFARPARGGSGGGSKRWRRDRRRARVRRRGVRAAGRWPARSAAGALARGPRAARAAAAWSTPWCGSGARAATRARPSGAGCCSRAPRWRGRPGFALAGPLAGLALGAGGPWLVARLLRARREHYRRAVERETAALALALADALAGGHSLRGALAEAAQACAGPAGHELRRVAAELAAGAATDDALEALRSRVPSRTAGRGGRGVPRAAPRGRRPGAAAARVRRGVRGPGAAGGRGAQRHGPGALHRRGGGAAADGRGDARRAREPGFVAGLLELVPHRVAGRDRARAPDRGRGGDPAAGAGALVIAPALAFAAAALGAAGLAVLVPRRRRPRPSAAGRSLARRAGGGLRATSSAGSRRPAGPAGWGRGR